MHYHKPAWKNILNLGLEEDVGQWDWTTQSLGPAQNKKLRAELIAKADGVWAAEGLIEAMVELSVERSTPIEVKTSYRDGQKFKKGDCIAEWRGEAAALLVFERPFLNLACYFCGIATQTRHLVDQVEKSLISPMPRITATRKTLPGYKELALAAVACGGGASHRLNLAAGVLLKENHISAAGGVTEAVKGALERAPHVFRVEVEVRDLKELKAALVAGAEVVMLDNFLPPQVREAVSIVEAKRKQGCRVIVEVSGGLNVSSISDYCVPGVDILSVGGLTHSVEAIDLSLLMADK